MKVLFWSLVLMAMPIVSQAQAETPGYLGEALVVISPDPLRFPLNFSVKISRSESLDFELSEKQGKCYLDGLDLKLNAPCDVNTKTSVNGFTVDNFDDPLYDTRTPRNVVNLEIIGSIRFNATRRAFCGSEWQIVTLTWRSKVRRKALPHTVNLMPMRSDRVSRCTRAYEVFKS